MNDVELAALELKRKAWEVLDGKALVDSLFEVLHRLNRQRPDFFELVAQQMERDNDKWAASSGLPNVSINRDASKKIESVKFYPIAKPKISSSISAASISAASSASISAASASSSGESESPTVVGDSSSLQPAPQPELQTDDATVIVWQSDYGDRNWIESFAKDYTTGQDGHEH